MREDLTQNCGPGGGTQVRLLRRNDPTSAEAQGRARNDPG